MINVATTEVNGKRQVAPNGLCDAAMFALRELGAVTYDGAKTTREIAVLVGDTPALKSGTRKHIEAVRLALDRLARKGLILREHTTTPKRVIGGNRTVITYWIKPKRCDDR